MGKTFKDVEIGHKLLVTYNSFPFSNQEEITVKQKSYKGNMVTFYCESKTGKRCWFPVNENNEEFYDEQSDYDSTRVEIL